MKKFAHVAVPINLNKTFSYSIPDNIIDDVQIGKRVLVPFSGRKVTGYVVDISNKSEVDDPKDIISAIDDIPLFSSDDLEFFKWLSAYYLTPLSEVIRTAMPAGINANSKRYYSITQEGEEYINNSRGKSKELLLFLKTNGLSSVSAISKETKIDNVTAILNRLVKAGALESKEVTSSGAVKSNIIRYIRVKDEKRGVFNDHIASFRKNAKNKIALCRHILNRGEIPYPTLTDLFSGVKQIVDELKTLDYIEIINREKDIGRHNIDIQKKNIEFNNDQITAIDTINSAIDEGGYHPFLLHGITGSGKTEVYIEAAQQAIKHGKGVIILVPEISLSPNLIRRFAPYFDQIGILHSSISPSEKYRYYLKILNGELKIVIGARSALFAPFKDLGLIVVDEEHESTYKQDDGFKYHARDIALVKAKQKGAVVLLGSATPSIESYYNAQSGRYKYLRLPSRVRESILPEIQIVDMKKEREEGVKKDVIISNELKRNIEENLLNKKQTMLFLNRRGHSIFVVCYDCGNTETCPNCSISLTLHRAGNILACHYCGFKKDVVNSCSKCGGTNLRPLGFGTQRVDEVVKREFPNAKVFRMDSDTMSTKGAYDDFYRMMENSEIDIVIGTQIIAKGHDFENVTLIGILNADSNLSMPDFRNDERCFAMITQVAGRAGRGAYKGRVIIQTFNPENDYIQYALNREERKFYEKEIELRKTLKFPPFSRLIGMRIISRNENSGIDAFNSLSKLSEKLVKSKKYRDISIFGPVTSPIYKIKNNFRWQMLIRSGDSKLLHHFASELDEKLTAIINKSHVKITIDVDPFNML